MARLKALRKCTLLLPLGFRDLGVLAHRVQEKKAAANQWLVREGEPSSGLIVLSSGRVELHRGEDGPPVEISAGDSFGELSLLGEDARGVGAKCVETCDYLLLTPKDFGKLLAEEPEVAGKIAHGVAKSVNSKVRAVLDLMGSVLDERAGERS